MYCWAWFGKLSLVKDIAIPTGNMYITKRKRPLLHTNAIFTLGCCEVKVRVALIYPIAEQALATFFLSSFWFWALACPDFLTYLFRYNIFKVSLPLVAICGNQSSLKIVAFAMSRAVQLQPQQPWVLVRRCATPGGRSAYLRRDTRKERVLTT